MVLGICRGVYFSLNRILTFAICFSVILIGIRPVLKQACFRTGRMPISITEKQIAKVRMPWHRDQIEGADGFYYVLVSPPKDNGKVG